MHTGVQDKLDPVPFMGPPSYLCLFILEVIFMGHPHMMTLYTQSSFPPQSIPTWTHTGTALVVCAVLNRCEQQTKVLDYIMMIAM